MPNLNERPPSLASVVYDRLKQMICNKEILPGARLIERNLAKELEVSRVPVREALLMLRKDGLAFDKPEVGLCVVEVNAEENCEYHEVLTALDTLVIRLVYENLTDETLTKLDENLAKTRQALENQDSEGALENCFTFHRLLRETTGNQYLIETCQQTEFLMTWHLPKAELAQINYEAHKEIVQALKARDKKALYVAFLKYNRQLGEYLSEF
ncbi:GntR family transcriptional regulator [Gleimia sp. 6138-11-ORH1]|uniref:GntR family transcriptional regulator n=1 Tax=Gleimia sp. 6138-11-ORH1 TaxID=2973937 RepID=UPI002169BE9E|nr:GntR family transcriptional regulator [Gleimia sp. 6138-11-ORH1]MCS4485073.1 GntR family transcriptional regulator [Gleimia sp. 6138-11-ORH1]